MERRKLLLGTAGTVTVAFAGCLGGGENEEPEERGSTSDSDDGDGNDDGTGEYDDVPGVDKDKLRDHENVKGVKRDGKTISVVIETEHEEIEKQYAQVETAAEDLYDALTDPNEFKSEIETVHAMLRNKAGEQVIGIYVDVRWIEKYILGEIDEEEFREQMETATD